MISYLRRLFKKETRILTSDQLAAYLSSGGGVSVSESTAIGIAAVYACVKILSESIAQLPLNLLQKGPDGAATHTRANGLYDVLHFQPNSLQTSFEFRESLMAKALLRGNGFAVINWNPQRNKVLELIPVDRATMKVLGNYNATYKATIGSKTFDVPWRNMFHLKGLSLDGYMGVSPLAYQKKTFKLALAGQQHGIATLENGARPGGILKNPIYLEDEQIDRIRESWEAAHGGGRQGGTAILEGGMEYTPITMSQADIQFIETNQLTKTDIFSIYRVPPHMAADLTKSSFNNIENMDLGFVKYSLLPWIKRWEQAIRRDLLTERQKASGIYADFNLTALERADLKTRSESYKDGIQNGWLSPNDVRQLEGLNPRPGGDIYLTPMNMSTNPDAALLRAPAKRKSSTIDERNQARHKYAKAIKLAATRAVMREVDAIQKATGKKDASDLLSWAESFYSGFSNDIKEIFRDAITAYANEVSAIALKDTDSDSVEGLKEFINSYLETFATRYTASSLGQVKQILDENDFSEAEQLVFERAGEWEEKRAQKVSANEAVQLGNAVTRFVWGAAGITALKWVAQGSKSCPFCQQMNGKTVGITSPFIPAGENLIADNGSGMKIRGKKMNPPIHQGCVCTIAPG